MAKEDLVKSPQGRVRRTPLEYSRNKLKVVGKDPNYEYRFVNITDDRVDEFLDRGWQFETSDEVRIGGNRVDHPKATGKVHELSVGQGQKAVLMKIRRDWYDEDQDAKQVYVKKTEEAMRPNPNDGGYGRVEISRK